MPENSLQDLALLLADTLKSGLQVELPLEFVPEFMAHAKRISPELRDDFVSLVVVECYESIGQGKSLSAAQLSLILDRIRHRVVRDTRPTVPAGAHNTSAPPSLYPETIAVFVKQFTEALSPEQVPVFMMFLEGRKPLEISKSLGISIATCYRIIADLRHQFTDFAQQLGLND